MLLFYILQKSGLCSRIYTMIDVYTGMSVGHSRRLVVVVSSSLEGRRRECDGVCERGGEREREAHAREPTQAVKQRELY